MMIADQQTPEDIAEMLLAAYLSRKPVEPLTQAIRHNDRGRI
jgi:hypothetical protein